METTGTPTKYLAEPSAYSLPKSQQTYTNKHSFAADLECGGHPALCVEPQPERSLHRGRYVAAGLGPSKDSSQLQDKDLPELERILASERQPSSVGLVDRYTPSVSGSLVPVIGGTLQNIAEFKRVLLKVPF
ncbi:hypothetical protein MRX96_027631 [Rhipicephalus microplus]